MHAGQGSGLTARTLGSYGGIESITQQSGKDPAVAGIAGDRAYRECSRG